MQVVHEHKATIAPTHEYVKCNHCLGVKEFMGMGGIIKDCHVCDKIGYVKVPLDDISVLAEKQQAVEKEENVLCETHIEAVEEIKVRKKPGRKPKVK